jgi:alpha-N-arabinofuranosidase
MTGKPSVSSGSDTYPLDVAAALTDDRKKVTVAIVNPTESIQELNLSFKGASFRNNVKIHRIAVPQLKAENTPSQESVAKTEVSIIKNLAESMQIAPFSISLYELELR